MHKAAPASIGLVLFVFAGCETPDAAPATGAAPPAAAQEPEGKKDMIDVKLCDGETHTQIPADTKPTKAHGQQIAAELMSQWQAKHPERAWGPDPDPAHAIVQPADNLDVVVATPTGETRDRTAEDPSQGSGHTYGSHSEHDVATWKADLMRTVTEGDRVFHDAEALGSTIAVSCDMCHPHAANTHPETYPKYQVQLGRVALLRDMINWCLEHPVRAERLDADDPRMRAMEAYIYAQRRGTPLSYGKR